MRAKFLLGALVVFLLTNPSPAADNEVQDMMGNALEKAYQSRLKTAEELAGKIAGALFKAEDPSSEVKAFVTFTEITFASTFTQALRDVSSERLADEQTRRKNIQALVEVAKGLPGHHSAEEAGLRKLEDGLDSLHGEYKEAFDDMVSAATDVLSADEVAEFEKRFDEIQKNAEALLAEYGAEVDSRNSAVRRGLEGCGSPGKVLAASAERGRVHFGLACSKLVNDYGYLLDWKGCRSPAGVRMIEYTKDAGARAAWAKEQLMDTISLYRQTIDGTAIRRQIEEVNDLAVEAYAQEHNYADGDPFRADAMELAAVHRGLQSKRGEILVHLSVEAKVAEDAIQASLDAVLKFTPTEKQKKALKDAVAAALKQTRSGIAEAEQRLKETERLVVFIERRVAHMAEIANLIDNLDEVDRSTIEASRALRRLTKANWELFKVVAGWPLGKLRELQRVYGEMSGALARIDEIQRAEAGGVSWPLYKKALTLSRMGVKLATVAGCLSELKALLTVTYHSVHGLGATMTLTMGSPEKQNEFVDEPDETTDEMLSDTVWKDFRSINFEDPGDIADKLPSSKLDLAKTPEGRRVLAALDASVLDVAAALKQSGREADIVLAASVLQLKQAVRDAYKAAGLAASRKLDKLSSFLESFEEERLELRGEQIDVIREALDEGNEFLEKYGDSASIEDLEELSAAVKELLKELEDVSVEAPAKEFDKEYPEADEQKERVLKAAQKVKVSER